MSFENYFPLWNDLNTAQKKLISDNLITQHVKKGTIIHNGNMDCTGLLLIKSGQLRTYILSNEGREITLYRLFDMDMCLLSASCIMRSIQFEVTIEAEKDTDLWIIPAEIYKGIMKESALNFRVVLQTGDRFDQGCRSAFLLLEVWLWEVFRVVDTYFYGIWMMRTREVSCGEQGLSFRLVILSV